MEPSTTAAMTQKRLISPEGSCRTFDRAADGFVRGEAINTIFIKRLDDAIQDNNPIQAVIRGTGTNSGGKSQGQKGQSQEALMRKLYFDTKLDVRKTAFVDVFWHKQDFN